MTDLFRTPRYLRHWLATAGVLLLASLLTLPSLAATIMVDNDCPLGAAITAANSDSNSHDSDCTAGSGADIVDLTNFTSSDNALVSGANITSNITIEGRGKTVGGAGTARVFTVAANGTLTLKNITVNSGLSTPSLPGGGVRNLGTTTIINSVIRSNNQSNVYSNGQLVIRGSTIRSGFGASGAGIRVDGGSLTISNSTVDSNTGSVEAGGIYIGGGARATFSHVTVWNNTASSNSTASALEINGASTAVSLRNSLFCDNDANTNDLLLTGGATLRQNVGNVIGEGSAKTTATCGDLGSRTGSPGYYLPPSGSGALGAGNAAFCKAYPIDQSGIYRPETACDAGAAERGGFNYIYADNSGCTISEAMISADEDSNSNAAGCVAGVDDSVATDLIWMQSDTTIGAALRSVDTTIILDGGGYKIGHAANTFRPFQVASGGDLTLRNISLEGFTQTSGGAILTNDKLTLQNCLLKDNTDTSNSGGGGALRITSSANDTIIDRCTFQGNVAQNDGGGAIKIDGGDVTITNSAFLTNDAVSNSGGAIFINDGDLTVSNSSFIGNTCQGSGCAVFANTNADAVNLWHNTFWDNATDNSGNVSGIHGGSTINLQNSIIGRSTTTGGALCGGNFANSNQERGILTWNGPEIDNCGDRTVGNPRLGAQTGSPPYLPLTAGSAAIGIGANNACAAYPFDVAGKSRPSTGCDAGAFQYVAPAAGGAAASGGSGEYRAPSSPGAAEPPVCTGEALNEAGAFKVSTTYGLCNGVQFNQLELSAIGIGYVVGAAPIAAVDVWGWVTAYVEVCWRGYASALFLDAATAPRTVSQLATTFDGVWTCAQISSAGTIVFLPAQSYLTTPPADVAAPDAPANATPFGSCMATLNYILNFRATPGGDVRMILPYGVKLTAFQRSGDWVEVDYHGLRGWVSASHVTLEGAC